jgi:hypothetical protein
VRGENTAQTSGPRLPEDDRHEEGRVKVCGAITPATRESGSRLRAGAQSA